MAEFAAYVSQYVVNGDFNVLRTAFWNAVPAFKGVMYLLVVGAAVQETAVFDFMTEEELKSVNCTEADFKYRQADGTCNNKELPKMGAKGTRLGRNTRSEWETETPPDSYLWHPAPEDAAELLSSLDGQRVEIPSLNLLFGAWIQFQVHDWFNHDNEVENPYTMKTRNGKSSFPLKRTKRDSDGYMRSTVTQWWDMSQVYGSDEETADLLRSFEDGKMELTEDGLLLKDNTTGQMQTGFTDNLWTGLETLHTLYTKEHNYICDQLKQRNPDFDDETLYQTARLINAAQNMIIHTEEWTAILLYNTPIQAAMRSTTRGVKGLFETYASKLTDEDKKFFSALDAAGLAGGGVGGTSRINGGVYSQTEGFVSVYRMHALLPDNMTFGGETTLLQDHAFRAGRRTMEKHGMEKAIEGLAGMNTHALVMNNYPYTLSHLVKDGDELNMAAIDIFRDRERGLPRHNDFREQLGLPRFATFEDINPDQAVADKLRAVYDTVDDIDLVVGLAAEDPRPAGYAISETTFWIFLVQTSRRLFSDRFYQESFNEETYTAWGIEYVLSARFRRLFENNYPSTLSSFVPSGDADEFFLESSAFLSKQ